MIRPLVWFLAAIALVAMLPAIPMAALSTGLQYDEIVRVVVGATPPPPGNFQADLAAIASPAPVAATSAPRRRGGFGNLGALAGGILSGNVGGAVTGAATDAVVGNALDAQVDRMVAQTGSAFAGAMRGLTQGRLERHSFYSGWERIDDVAGQTATITKCDLHQIIKLDLAKKTYRLSDPSAVAAETAPPARPRSHEREPQAKPAPEAPGTAVADLRNVVTPLGARKLEGLDTTGYDDTSTFAMTQATGSCRNGTFAFHSKAYYTRLAAPRLVCPLVAGGAVPTQRYPQEPMNFVASGGCRPTFTAHKSGPPAPAQNLSLYQTIAMSGAAGSAPPDATGSAPSGFVFLTERGNVHALTPANASLFEIPADFTRLP